jgi:hypothetical protein
MTSAPSRSAKVGAQTFSSSQQKLQRAREAKELKEQGTGAKARHEAKVARASKRKKHGETEQLNEPNAEEDNQSMIVNRPERQKTGTDTAKALGGPCTPTLHMTPS